MRLMASLLTKKPKLSVTHAYDKIWHPNHGIVFGSTPQPASTIACRASSTLGLVDNNQERQNVLYCSSDNPPLLSKPTQSPQSQPRGLLIGSQSKSDTSDYIWGLSSARQALRPNDDTTEDGRNTEGLEFQSDRDGDGDGGTLHKPLTFQIAESTLRKAREAAPGTKESFWSYKMFSGPEGQEVKVHYCKSKHTAEQVAQYFLNEKTIGFDIEWKADSTKNSGIKSNVSLIQIASETRIGLFHIAIIPKDNASDLVAPTLKKIIEDSNITKVGVAIKADCTRLRNFLEIDSRGLFELSHLYKLVRHSSSGDTGLINKSLVSLSTQAEHYLELPIFKGDVRRSDWSQPLGMDQIIYSASDAYANLMLYDTLESKRKQLRPVPPRPYHAELNIPIRLAAGALSSAGEEATDDVEPEVKRGEPPSSKPAFAGETAAQNAQIEDDFEPNDSIQENPSRAGKQLMSSKKPVVPLTKSQTLIDAESWATAHRASNPAPPPTTSTPTSATFAALRTYRLWSTQPELSIGEIASMLRQPPLQKTTVAQYILDSIRLEKLPFEEGRLKDVLLSVPDSRSLWRYKALWKLVD